MSEQRHIGPLFSAEDEACLTHVQMKDYAAGKISKADKHHIERHLLNCELCALAFEGLADEEPEAVAENVSAIVSEAWSRVEATEKKRRRGAFMWMSSAAAILLLILVGFFVIDQQQDKELEQLADSMFELPEAPIDAPNKDLESGDLASAEQPDEPADFGGEKKSMEETGDVRGNANWGGGDGGVIQPPAAVDAPDEIVLADAEVPMEVEESEMMFDEIDDFAVEEAMPEEEVIEMSKDVVANEPVMDKGPLTKSDATTRSQTEDVGGAEIISELDGLAVNEKNQADNKELTLGLITATDSVSTDPGFFADANADFDAADDEDGDLLAENQMQQVVTQPNLTTTGTATGGINNGVAGTTDMDQTYAYSNTTTITGGALEEVEIADVKKESRNRRDNESMRMDRTVSRKAKAAAPRQEQEKLENKTDFYRLGLDAYESRDFPTGARYLRQAASESPANLQAHFYASMCFMEMDQHSAALFHLDRIIAQPANSLSEEALWYKSIALMRMGKKKEAEVVLKQIKQEGGKRKSDADKVLDKF